MRLPEGRFNAAEAEAAAIYAIDCGLNAFSWERGQRKGSEGGTEAGEGEAKGTAGASLDPDRCFAFRLLLP